MYVCMAGNWVVANVKTKIHLLSKSQKCLYQLHESSFLLTNPCQRFHENSPIPTPKGRCFYTCQRPNKRRIQVKAMVVAVVVVMVVCRIVGSALLVGCGVESIGTGGKVVLGDSVVVVVVVVGGVAVGVVGGVGIVGT